MPPFVHSKSQRHKLHPVFFSLVPDVAVFHYRIGNTYPFPIQLVLTFHALSDTHLHI
jgi:hypothetical protein